MLARPLTAILALLVLAGCATTNFATSPSPATVREEWIRKDLTIWGGSRIFGIGNLEFGMLRYENDTTFTVNPGPTVVKVYYYANRGNSQGLFWMTDVASMPADLKPNGRYQVRGNYGEEEVTFFLIDLDTNARVAETQPSRIVRRPTPMEQSLGATPIPIIIPAR